MNPLLVKTAIGALIAIGLIIGYRVHAFSSFCRTHAEGSAPVRRICCICLKDFDCFRVKVSLPCNHYMHKRCAELFFTEEKGNNCPLCRMEISRGFFEGKSL